MSVMVRLVFYRDNSDKRYKVDLNRKKWKYGKIDVVIAGNEREIQ